MNRECQNQRSPGGLANIGNPSTCGSKGFSNTGFPFLDRYERAQKGERRGRQVDPILKRWVGDIREREWQCCGQKIQYFLKREHKAHLSVPKIYEILSEKYIIRSRWQKNRVRGPIPQASQPREVIQMDSVDFGGLFAFTAVDIFTREADVLLAPELTARYGLRFLKQSMVRRFDRHVHLIQTDRGPEFKADFLADVAAFCDRHRVAGLIARTSNPISRASTAHCARSAWVGITIVQTSCRNVRRW